MTPHTAAIRTYSGFRNFDRRLEEYRSCTLNYGSEIVVEGRTLEGRDLEVLRIVIGISGVEVDHFGLWHDKAGNAVATPIAGLIDPVTGLTFSDLNAPPTELTQTNLILPEPRDFLKGEKLPPVRHRSFSYENAGAVVTIKSFTADLLFAGQSTAFFDFIMELAVEADAARRDL